MACREVFNQQTMEVWHIQHVQCTYVQTPYWYMYVATCIYMYVGTYSVRIILTWMCICTYMHVYIHACIIYIPVEAFWMSICEAHTYTCS